jgi:hypothetical protein
LPWIHAVVYEWHQTPAFPQAEGLSAQGASRVYFMIAGQGYGLC